jgi:hypothetical protein
MTTTPSGIFLDTMNNKYNIPGAVPIPPQPVAPLIPATATTVANICSLAGWKMEKDSGTPGTAKNITMTYNATTKACLFSANQTGKGGVRWSRTIATGVPDTVANYVYDITYEFPDPMQQACVEMDINHVDSKGDTYLLCVQASEYSDSYEYTLLKAAGSYGWNPSTIKVNPTLWPKNTPKHIRIFTQRNLANGKVVYVGVEEDAVYNPFAATCTGVSDSPMGWTKQIILPNFQLDGANASGLMQCNVLAFDIIYW